MAPNPLYAVIFTLRNPDSITDEIMATLMKDLRDFFEFFDGTDHSIGEAEPEMCLFYYNVPQNEANQMAALKTVGNRKDWLEVKVRPMVV